MNPINRLPERTRWKIAGWLDKLPGQCWADLVTWALYAPDDDLPLWSPAGSLCLRGVAENGSCYCGKRATPEVRAARAALDGPPSKETSA